jgi:multimeric flavodoxin WrbA
MSRKITIICGSPRKEGNTNRVVGWVAEAARQAGAEVEIVDAPRLSYKALGCTACMGCRKSEEFRCVVDDEASPILARLPESDAVVLATPIYWLGPTAQLKVFTDRMFSLIKFTDTGIATPLKGTTLAVIATAGGERDHGLGLLEQTWRASAGFLGVPFESFLVPVCPQDPEELARKAKADAEAFGRKLAGA